MTLTAADKRVLRRALRIAIDSDAALIDAYRIAWSKRQRGVKVLSEEGKKIAVRFRRYIAGYQRVLAAIDRTVDKE